MTRQTKFIISLVGMALSAAVLILLIPGLQDASQSRSMTAVCFAALTVAFSIGVHTWRPRQR